MSYSLVGAFVKFRRTGVSRSGADPPSPLGISFYTLQAIAHITDFCRGKAKADRNPFKFLLFMSFFPQIVRGPTARHKQPAARLCEGHGAKRQFIVRGLCSGIFIMAGVPELPDLCPGILRPLLPSRRVLRDHLRHPGLQRPRPGRSAASFICEQFQRRRPASEEDGL